MKQKLQSLTDGLIRELQELYSAETQLTKALPQMAKAASNEELAAAFEMHLEETKRHVDRLEEIFEQFNVSMRGERCKVMECLIEEAKSILAEKLAAPEVRDALMIANAQKVEHYEIASYGTVRTFAEHLRKPEAARLLQETLDEEIEADEKLTQIAEKEVNQEAEALGIEV